jgi:hypothetical protein
MTRGCVRRATGWAFVAVVGTLAMAACGRSPEPIVVESGAITVRNLTGSDWRDVRVWVNEYYAGGARELPAGGFLREPVDRFAASQGQRLARGARVTSVVVLATDASGERIRIAWGEPVLH